MWASWFTVYENQEIDFSNTDDVFNIVTKVVLPPSKASIFIAHDSIGEELYIKFKEERLQGDWSVWDPMKKRKMPTFANTSKSSKTKVDDKIVEIKEEGLLLHLEEEMTSIYQLTSEDLNSLLSHDLCSSKMVVFCLVQIKLL